MPYRDDDRDSFWDIERLTPPHRGRAYAPRDTSGVLIDAGQGTGEQPQRLTFPPESVKNGDELLLEYSPENILLSNVRVFHRPTRYDYFSQFLFDAHRLFDCGGSADAPHVSFFSYIPQYSQLSAAQLDFYLSWRAVIRRGDSAPADFGYVMLLIYEIINLPDRLPPAEGLSMLVSLWLSQRAAHPRLDKYMSEWVCDYCLVHRLPCPQEKLSPILSPILREASLREFYLGYGKDSPDGYARAVISYASAYDFNASKYAVGEYLPYFTEHIPASVARLLRMTESEHGSIFSVSQAHSRTKRDAFCGALCAHTQKRILDIEYVCFSRSYSLRYTLSDAVKYSENRLRARLGIKSRLSVSALPDEAKAVIDAYYEEKLPKSIFAVKKKEAPVPEYEAFYDGEKSALSISRAGEIERASWNTTRLLVPDEDTAGADSAAGKRVEEAPPAVRTADQDGIPHAGEPLGGYNALLANLDVTCLSFLTAAARSAGGGEEYARSISALPDTLAEKINECSLVFTGDIVIEDAGQGYRLLPDYRKEVIECLKMRSGI